MASYNNSLKVHEILRISPSTNSATKFSLPLTFFDILMLNIPPVECLFFYQLTELNPELFNSVILPKLTHSLSLTLLHYLPLAGKLKWPPNAPKPAIYYSLNDAVSVTVAESKADFNRLSSHEIRDAVELRPLTPELFTSEDAAEIVSLQITMFPNQGFCIGISTDHAVLDGNSITMFIKSWVYICKKLVNGQDPSLLPPELAPLFDRTLINDPDKTDMLLVKSWLDLDSNSRSLKRLTHVGANSNLVRATFELTREDINKLRGKVLSIRGNEAKQLRLSTFVVVCAYAFVCVVKAREGASDGSVLIGFAADYRARLDPPVPKNYLGNCIRPCFMHAKARDFTEENGIAIVAEKLSEGIEGLESKLWFVEEPRETLEKIIKITSDDDQQERQRLGVSWSAQFEVYGLDFGWWRPTKMEIVSIDRGGSISMAKSRDGNGGVEIGLVLDKLEMDAFASLFVDGLMLS